MIFAERGKDITRAAAEQPPAVKTGRGGLLDGEREKADSLMGKEKRRRTSQRAALGFTYSNIFTLVSTVVGETYKLV